LAQETSLLLFQQPFTIEAHKAPIRGLAQETSLKKKGESMDAAGFDGQGFELLVIWPRV
jgi:hypothetical protein